MDQQTKQLLIEHFKKVPSDVRELVLSDILAEDIQSISSEYGLTDKQRDALQSEVRLILLGITELEHFTENIRAELEADSKTASDIVVAVDTHIFSLVRESLNSIHGYTSTKEAPSGMRERGIKPPAPLRVRSEVTGSDPVAASILGENRRPGAQSDPYREPIDEE